METSIHENKVSAIISPFFADDLIPFGEAGIEQARIMNDIVNEFSYFSGHKVSSTKTQILFSKNTGIEFAESISSHMGFQRVNELGKYLGVLLLYARVTCDTYEFIMEKVRCKLNGWDAKLLSGVGRITLAKSVLVTIPNYFMQSTLISVRVCNEVERLVRQFIWGSTPEKKAVALVK